MAKTRIILAVVVTFLGLSCVRASSSDLDPLVPILCPHNDYDTNTCYQMTSVNRTCVIVAFGQCNDGVNHHHWWAHDICWITEVGTCTVSKCEKKCCEGWSMDNEGRCDQAASNEDIECEYGVRNLGGILPKCDCFDGYTGPSCSIPYCEGGCQNGGTCRSTPDGQHSCHCPRPFTGRNCETVSCLEPCLNGGTCVSNCDEAVCVCPQNYYGKTCKHEIDGTLCPLPNVTDCWKKDCKDECINTAGCLAGHVCCSDGCRMKCMRPVTKTCFHDNRYYRAGEIFQKDACTHCTCMVNGTVFCEGIKCPQVECDGDLEYENYMCCPVCKEHSILPPDYKPPSFSRCFDNIVLPLNVSRYGNTFYLSNLQLQAWDYAGNKLQVDYNPSYIDHCRCSKTERGTRLVSVSAVDGYGGRSECNFWVYVADPIAPSFLSCPADIVAYEDEIIYWDEPTALDNVGIPYLWSSADQGYTFDVGITTVTYTALDYDDNKAICEFDVIVYSEDTDPSKSRGLSCRRRKSHRHAGLIAGIVCGTLVLLILVAAFLIRVRRQRMLHRRQATNLSTVSNVNYDIGAFPDYKGSSTKTKPPEYSPPTNPPAYDELNNDNVKSHTYMYVDPPHYDELSVQGDDTNGRSVEEQGTVNGTYETTGDNEREASVIDIPTHGHVTC